MYGEVEILVSLRVFIALAYLVNLVFKVVIAP